MFIARGYRTSPLVYERGTSGKQSAVRYPASQIKPIVLLVMDSNGRNIVNPQVVNPSQNTSFNLAAISIPGGKTFHACTELRHLEKCRHKVSHIVLALGTNDVSEGRHVLSKLRPRIENLVNAAKTVYLSAKISYVSILPRHDEFSDVVPRANEILQRVTEDLHITHLTVTVPEKPWYWSDAIHLSDKGLRAYMLSLEREIEDKLFGNCNFTPQQSLNKFAHDRLPSMKRHLSSVLPTSSFVKNWKPGFGIQRKRKSMEHERNGAYLDRTWPTCTKNLKLSNSESARLPKYGHIVSDTVKVASLKERIGENHNRLNRTLSPSGGQLQGNHLGVTDAARELSHRKFYSYDSNSLSDCMTLATSSGQLGKNQSGVTNAAQELSYCISYNYASKSFVRYRSTGEQNIVRKRMDLAPSGLLREGQSIVSVQDQKYSTTFTEGPCDTANEKFNGKSATLPPLSGQIRENQSSVSLLNDTSEVWCHVKEYQVKDGLISPIKQSVSHDSCSWYESCINESCEDFDKCESSEVISWLNETVTDDDINLFQRTDIGDNDREVSCEPRKAKYGRIDDSLSVSCINEQGSKVPILNDDSSTDGRTGAGDSRVIASGSENSPQSPAWGCSSVNFPGIFAGPADVVAPSRHGVVHTL